MKKTQNTDNAALDAAYQSLTKDNVVKWLTDDVGRCISLLHTVHNDPDLLRMVADHLYHRAQNEINSKKAKESLTDKHFNEFVNND